jgi:chromosome partitioning protein
MRQAKNLQGLYHSKGERIIKLALISQKGGVGKTTTAIHLAAYLSNHAPALLVDGDSNRSALGWAERGDLGFMVVSEKQSPKYWGEFKHCIIDTGARPDKADLQDLSEICDQLIVMTACDALSLDVLMPTIETLRAVGADHYRVLLSLVPPVGYAGAEALESIRDAGLPVFKGYIRRFVAYQRASLFGLTVAEVADPHADDAWHDIQAIGKELMK